MTQNISTFNRRICILGLGSIAIGLIPLLKRHFPSAEIVVITDNVGSHTAEELKIDVLLQQKITEETYSRLLGYMALPGDIIVNLTVDVGCRDLIQWCRDNNVCYIDTCIQPWLGHFTDTSIDRALQTNYALREDVLSLGKMPGNSTAVIAHGANPGLVNHFVKKALVDISSHFYPGTMPSEWSSLAEYVGLKVIHISEQDTQTAKSKWPQADFISTWSVDGFLNEGQQPAELGWGSHEDLIADGNSFSFGCGAAIYLNSMGMETRAYGWTPSLGEYEGYIITHNEAISIADYFSSDTYRPSVYYVYNPCPAATESIEKLKLNQFQPPKSKQILGPKDIKGGYDELGVLLMGDFGAYWYGSHLNFNEVANLCPNSNATTLQVTAPIIAAMLWMIDNPNAGICEADDLPYDYVLDICKPYLGRMYGIHTTWEPAGHDGSWKFGNFRV